MRIQHPYLPVLPIVLFMTMFNGVMAAQSASDTSSILKAVEHWETGWNEGNIAQMTADYAREVDWTNAFGDRVIGRDSLKSFLRLFMSFGFVRAGQSENISNDLSFIHPEIALLRSTSLVSGQLHSNGEPMGDRHLHHLRVFEKRNDRWKIVSHLISQEQGKK